MSMGRWWGLLVVAAVLVGVALWWHRADVASTHPDRGPPSHAAASATTNPGPLTKEAREKLLRDSVEAHLADDLNKPDGTIQADLALLASVFAAYRSIYAGRGNPVGDNREITDTLLGKNTRGIIFLQDRHRAIDASGELCDRWGTPFSFHAESGTKMEVRSAGPDRKMWTADDVFLMP
jgi:hypothetical protein